MQWCSDHYFAVSRGNLFLAVNAFEAQYGEVSSGDTLVVVKEQRVYGRTGCGADNWHCFCGQGVADGASEALGDFVHDSDEDRDGLLGHLPGAALRCSTVRVLRGIVDHLSLCRPDGEVGRLGGVIRV